jgi:hypothetical protein
MTEDKSIEQRLAALEATMAELQKRLRPPTSGNWVEGWISPVADEEAFLQAMEFARAYRKMHFPPEADASGNCVHPLIGPIHDEETFSKVLEVIKEIRESEYPPDNGGSGA